jgi:hypothetical protein
MGVLATPWSFGTKLAGRGRTRRSGDEVGPVPRRALAKDFPDAHEQFIATGGVFDAIYEPGS